ncbi:hypothetical protein [Vibrio sp. THAF190c]|uniref:hypothetical protein n=1 Tax=Vibrio sp. THAF190c TaxID=2587865 RepID=UPI0012685EFB|nr:hypothetical protein [Vibrio sp. THAF190c]QFT13579.1 hypothetical protein FIV04_26850 [Vibrio sp. THAF190c]
MNYSQKLLAEHLQKHPEHNQYVSAIDLSKAERAFHATSFSPERRGVLVVVDYAQRCEGFKVQLNQAITTAKANGIVKVCEQHLEEIHKHFQKEIAQLFINYIHAESVCMSSAITGPANFPVERNKKRLASAMNKYDAIAEREKQLYKRAVKMLLPDGDGTVIKSDSASAVQQLEAKLEQLVKEKEMWIAINKMVRKVYPKGQLKAGATQNDIDELIKDLQTSFGLYEDAAINLLKPCRITSKVVAFPSYSLTNRSQEIKRTEQRIKEQKKLEEGRESNQLNDSLDNGIEYELTEDNKIAIHFTTKPSEEVRSILKSNAFKCSRHRNYAWVRKHTLNAQNAFVREVLPVLKDIAA